MNDYTVYWDFWSWLTKPGYREHRKYPGWKDFIDFYKIKCPKHGTQYNYPQGYKQRLECPVCQKNKAEGILNESNK